MSVPYPQQPAPQVTVKHPPPNHLGLAGFITSILGLITCGVLAPIGLILSLIGLSKQPRGFAVAGTIIGLVGSIFLAVVGVGLVLGALGLSAAAKEIKNYTDAHATARTLYLQLDQQRKAGTAITAASAGALVGKHNDPWGTPFRAEVAADGAITIITAGRDKKFNTADDNRFDELALQSASPTTMPGGGGGGSVNDDE